MRASEPTLGTREQLFPTIALFVVTIGVCVVLVLPPKQGVRNWRKPQAWKNMDQVAMALVAYHARHGTFPRDTRGADYALYAFAEDLPASTFDASPRAAPAPDAYWDHKAKRLVASDLAYLNPGPSIEPGDPVIVLAETQPAGEWILVGLATGHVRGVDCPGGACGELLGSWETWDQFLAENERVWRDWNALQLPGTYELHAAGSMLRYGTGTGVRVEYKYDGDNLQRRTWRLPNGTITETVQTDAFGRIIAIERQPANWKSLWPSWEGG